MISSSFRDSWPRSDTEERATKFKSPAARCGGGVDGGWVAKDSVRHSVQKSTVAVRAPTRRWMGGNCVAMGAAEGDRRIIAGDKEHQIEAHLFGGRAELCGAQVFARLIWSSWRRDRCKGFFGSRAWVR